MDQQVPTAHSGRKGLALDREIICTNSDRKSSALTVIGKSFALTGQGFGDLSLCLSLFALTSLVHRAPARSLYT